MATPEQPDSDPRRRKRRRRRSSAGAGRGVWLARVLLLLTVVALAALARWGGNSGTDIRPIGIGDVQNRGYVFAWMRDIGLAFAKQFLSFVPVGFFAYLSLRWHPGWIERQLRVTIPALALSGAIAVLVEGLGFGTRWRWPGLLLLVAPLCGALLGGWAGSTWRRGWEARLFFLPKLALGFAGLLLAVGGVLYLAAESKPLEIEAPRVPVAEKRRLRGLFQGKDPRDLPDGQTATLRLEQRDLDSLFAWANTLGGSKERRARVELGEDHATVEATMGLPLVRISRRFINVSGSGELAIDDGRPYFLWNSFRVGGLSVPEFLLRYGSPLVVRLVRDDRHAKILLEPVEKLRIHQRAVEMTYGKMTLPKGFVSDLFRSQGANPDLAPAIQSQLQNLIQLSTFFPSGDQRFGAAMQAAFGLARQRSMTREAVTENKAAILALGVLVGHWRLVQPLGLQISEDVLKGGLGAYRDVALRGRWDWARHFTVSAAIVVLSSEGIANTAGVLKEELDAQGGSGFSFGDLLADKAGTRFATVAIRDPESAVAIQQRLLGGFKVDDFFPPTAGLEENIQDQDFERHYGGTGGMRFQAMIQDIDQRVESCAAYRDAASPTPTPTPTATPTPEAMPAPAAKAPATTP